MHNSSFTDWANRSALYVALLVAWVAMLGSLYFSDVAGYVPCTLCWYQRILMYPLAGLLALGLLRCDPHLPYLVIPFSLLGQVVSTYHYLIQKTTIFGAPTACQTGVPCTSTWINWLGFITIPLLAMIGFFLITIFSLVALTAGEPAADDSRATPWAPVFGTIIVVVLVFSRPGWWNTRADPGPTLTETQSEGTVSEGSQLYLESCAACHGPDARGVEHLGKSLVDSEIIALPDNAEVLAFIRAGVGLDDPRNTTGLVMPNSGGRPDLSDDQILAIVDFIRSE